MKNNPVIENILARRSTRSFTDEPVDEESLKTILQAGAYAPSGMNLQLWQFTLVTNPEILKELTTTVRDVYKSLYVHKDEEYYIKNHLIKEVSENYDYSYGAKAMIILSAPKDAAMGLPDCAAACENMMLAATSLNIGSCWINQLHWLTDQPLLKNLLCKIGMPENHSVQCSIALGYIKTPTAVKPRKEGVVKIVK